MKIAIPTAEGLLCPHFGHCQEFAFIEVDPRRKEITNVEMVTPPPHQPGVLPQWLGQMGVDLIIAGGMGGRAIQTVNQQNLKVLIGAPSARPQDVVIDYLNDRLRLGQNVCDH